MTTEKKSQNPVTEAALKVCSREELQQMPEIALRNLGFLIDKRLREDGPPPSVEELQGIKELATEDLWHPAVGAYSKPK